MLTCKPTCRRLSTNWGVHTLACNQIAWDAHRLNMLKDQSTNNNPVTTAQNKHKRKNKTIHAQTNQWIHELCHRHWARACFSQSNRKRHSSTTGSNHKLCNPILSQKHQNQATTNSKTTSHLFSNVVTHRPTTRRLFTSLALCLRCFRTHACSRHAHDASMSILAQRRQPQHTNSHNSTITHKWLKEHNYQWTYAWMSATMNAKCEHTSILHTKAQSQHNQVQTRAQPL